MDEFFKNLKDKLSIENMQEFIFDENPIDIVNAREEMKESKDVTNNIMDLDPKPSLRILQKPIEHDLDFIEQTPSQLEKKTSQTINQSEKTFIDDKNLIYSDTAKANLKVEESNESEKKPNPVGDLSFIF